MANITIDFNNNNVRNNLFENSFVEKLIFENKPENKKYFQIKGLYLYGGDANGKLTGTANYHIETLPDYVDVSYLGNLKPSNEKRLITKEVLINTDLSPLCKKEVESLSKFFPTTTQIIRMILVITFFDEEKNELDTINATNFVSGILKINKVIRIENGLIEKNNHFLSSKLTDFIGTSSFVRDDKEFTITNGFFERNFKYIQYVVIVNKENNRLGYGDSYGIYTRYQGRRSGLIEKGETENDFEITATHWKIVSYDGFIQTYLSYDNMNEWIASGGGQLIEPTDIQGFYVETKDKPLVVKDYKVYKTPYIKFINLPIGYYVQIFDNKNKQLHLKKALNGYCEIYLDKPLIDVYFKILNEREVSVYTSDKIDINLGDVFSDSKYDLEVFYHNNLIETYSNNFMPTYREMVTIKNIGDKVYENIKVNVNIDDDNIDTVEICLATDVPQEDDYKSSVVIGKLGIGEIQNIYMRVTKSNLSSNYGRKGFCLEFN